MLENRRRAGKLEKQKNGKMRKVFSAGGWKIKILRGRWPFHGQRIMKYFIRRFWERLFCWKGGDHEGGI